MKKISFILKVSIFLLMYSCGNNVNTPDNINTKASLPDSFKFNPKGLKVITTFINKEQGTMSTLFGNSLAQQKAMAVNEKMMAGELFTLVTWKQQPDAHWFGANIPGDLQSVEVIQTTSAGETLAINYQLYAGKYLVLHADTFGKSEKIKSILDLKPSIMP